MSFLLICLKNIFSSIWNVNNVDGKCVQILHLKTILER